MIMKKFKILLLFLFVGIAIQAQVSKTVNVTTSGTLKTYLTPSEKVTNLTVTGTIDARDFAYLRDYIDISLTVLDISGASIAAYTGMVGLNPVYTNALANTIPNNAFSYGYGSAYLTSVTLPSTITSIGDSAFSLCPNLTTINIPPSVTYIGQLAFIDCVKLNSIAIPSSVSYIGQNAFRYCIGLQSIYNYSSTPLNINKGTSYSVFAEVDTAQCILYVPKGSKGAYQTTAKWKDFKQIVEFDATDVPSITSNNNLIYPNPSTSSINLTVESESSIFIYNLSGVLVLNTQTSKNENVCINSLPCGVYIVKIITGNSIAIQRLIKQ
jgi:hypothetical protein